MRLLTPHTDIVVQGDIDLEAGRQEVGATLDISRLSVFKVGVKLGRYWFLFALVIWRAIALIQKEQE